ncbi:MAG: TonB C-terminal domain-containing protein [Aquabacterium sp.]|uniref:energy transducer TonB n=1 Tax=Aquabacterium sp. TaxID=1872578 RepID=UPI0025C3725F|nr:energy transducer TonB [Aquabacterium sp.]MBI5925194.1 TonB C-terminal domain-containing protein [Aquabacterium sp.]
MNADAVSQGSGPVLRPRSADGWGLGGALALGVHLMLVAALALGVRWKMSTPDVVEAEVWAEIPRAAAPEAPPPPPKVETPPVEPPPEPVKAVEPEPPAPEPVPDVVVERKPKKEPKKRKPQEPREVFITDEPVKSVKKPEKTPPKKPEPATKPVNSKTTSRTDSQGKPGSQQNAPLKGIMAQLEASLGAANRSAGPSAAYAGRIVARVKPNIIFTESISGDPRAVVEVHCSPDGRIIARKLIEPSGVPSWDEAVMRAIDKTEVLPKNEQGEVPISMQLGFRYKDF